jgi:hypothetical protein
MKGRRAAEVYFAKLQTAKAGESVRSKCANALHDLDPIGAPWRPPLTAIFC